MVSAGWSARGFSPSQNDGVVAWYANWHGVFCLLYDWAHLDTGVYLVVIRPHRMSGQLPLASRASVFDPLSSPSPHPSIAAYPYRPQPRTQVIENERRAVPVGVVPEPRGLCSGRNSSNALC